MQLLIATHNRGKIREVRRVLEQLPVTLRTLDEFPNVVTVEETGVTYSENAVLKALGYAQQTGILTLADDSGLEVDALDGGPGVFSARFGKGAASNADRLKKLLTMTSQSPSKARTARFVCCLAVADVESNSATPCAQLVTVIEKHCDGSIATMPRGENGFGYDPIFVPAGYSATFGELSDEVKRRISHRGKALTAFSTFLTSRIGNLTDR